VRDKSHPDRFIAATFRSIWALELLLYLRSEGEVAHSREELVKQLRASDAVVETSIGSLIAAGLVLEEEGKVRYAPASADLDDQVLATEKMYRARPDAVRRLIISGSIGGFAAFADAFRLKGD